METGLDTDMSTVRHWPGRVRVIIRIDHPQDLPEEWQLALHPDSAPSRVCVAADPALAARGDGRRLPWQDLPGRTLRLRSLGAVAVSLFDSVKMVPRICGLPTWRAVSLIVIAEGHDLRSTQIELRLWGGPEAPRVALRHRRSLEEPWVERSVPLVRWDADPLRAVLRVGMALREAGPRPMASRGSAFRESLGPMGRSGDPQLVPVSPS